MLIRRLLSKIVHHRGLLVVLLCNCAGGERIFSIKHCDQRLLTAPIAAQYRGCFSSVGEGNRAEIPAYWCLVSTLNTSPCYPRGVSKRTSFFVCSKARETVAVVRILGWHLIWIGAELLKPSGVDRWLVISGLIMEKTDSPRS
ncbi:hypothetical protein B0T10DRAFT_477868 [Thelonectria olida]|uniref:Secreted protein n=1 Tax=Thelonectria olida TaxID=1576542 RepID=A0A9P8WC75_9HYPO|nr:hypothetical protein B0T10DRAFT_477868 [Thelonectria olida]